MSIKPTKLMAIMAVCVVTVADVLHDDDCYSGLRCIDCGGCGCDVAPCYCEAAASSVDGGQNDGG